MSMSVPDVHFEELRNSDVGHRQHTLTRHGRVNRNVRCAVLICSLLFSLSVTWRLILVSSDLAFIPGWGALCQSRLGAAQAACVLSRRTRSCSSEASRWLRNRWMWY